ncbi:hypothetical protein QBC34DRAFT_441651 [Podospora aff. communis PSN243]|uniref:Uncharacterized protein n=1 Tax=Podospora aff. communis PSN243 TaxID=3040156 RepID=A0AAV9GE65_9PEZI|nr:hypothetical protein QBC34DRAFT_441651 [Podospora aff. communis PSN243]
MFKFLKKPKDDPKEDASPSLDGTSQPPKEKKKSLYQRFHDSKRGEISPEDVLKYTGKTKEQINEWAKNEPGVAGNQAAGKLSMGGTSGLGGMSAAEGYGGWGPNSNAPLKFPPKQTVPFAQKKKDGMDADKE